MVELSQREALWSHGQGCGLRDGWRIGATLGICHSGLAQRSRSQVVPTERPGFWRLSPLGLSHRPRCPLRCLYQSCFPMSLCSQLAATARNLFLNLASQLLIPSLSFKDIALKDCCLFWLQGNRCSVHNDQARWITRIQLYNSTPRGDCPLLTYSSRLLSGPIWDLFSLSNRASCFTQGTLCT